MWTPPLNSFLIRPTWLLALLLCLTSPAPAEPLNVRVGGYQFSPFVDLDARGRASGLTLELIALMNQQQAQYHFQFVATEPSLRFREFSAGRFDLVFFENIAWGWQRLPVRSSRVFLRGGERYLALAGAGRDQSYFNDLAGKRLVGIKGYHYGFAGFNSNPDYLTQHFNIQLIDSNAGSIRMLLSGRVDIAVVTEAFLEQYLQQHPDLRSQLLVSEIRDQDYQHTILVRDGIKPDAADMDKLLDQLQANGSLQQLWQKYGIMEP